MQVGCTRIGCRTIATIGSPNAGCCKTVSLSCQTTAKLQQLGKMPNLLSLAVDLSNEVIGYKERIKRYLVQSRTAYTFHRFNLCKALIYFKVPHPLIKGLKSAISKNRTSRIKRDYLILVLKIMALKNTRLLQSFLGDI